MAGNGYPSFLRNGLPGSTGIFTCGYYRRVPGLKCTVHPGNTRRNLSNALPGSNTRGYYISGYLRVTGTCWRGPRERNTHVMPYADNCRAAVPFDMKSRTSRGAMRLEVVEKEVRCNTGIELPGYP